MKQPSSRLLVGWMVHQHAYTNWEQCTHKLDYCISISTINIADTCWPHSTSKVPYSDNAGRHRNTQISCLNRSQIDCCRKVLVKRFWLTVLCGRSLNCFHTSKIFPTYFHLFGFLHFIYVSFSHSSLSTSVENYSLFKSATYKCICYHILS